MFQDGFPGRWQVVGIISYVEHCRCLNFRIARQWIGTEIRMYHVRKVFWKMQDVVNTR